MALNVAAIALQAPRGGELSVYAQYVLVANWANRRNQAIALLNAGGTPVYFHWEDDHMKEIYRPTATPMVAMAEEDPPESLLEPPVKKPRLWTPHHRHEPKLVGPARDQLKAYINYVISDVLSWADALGLVPFPRVGRTGEDGRASTATIMEYYGTAIASRRKGGTMEMSGVRTHYRRLRRLFELAVEQGPIEPDRVLQLCQLTGWKGVSMCGTLLWATDATGIQLFKQLAADRVISSFVPGGLDAVVTKRDRKTAPWVPDAFFCYIEDQCFADDERRRARAAFIRSCALGGARFMDGQHIIATHVTKPAVPLSWQAPGEIKHTLSRMKASKGPEREYILLPLVDSRMRDMSQAYADLKAQANPTAGFCLAAPRNPKKLVDGPVDRRHQCSYTTAIKMIREFAAEFQQGLPDDHPDKNLDLTQITFHSFRHWLNTLAAQGGMDQEQRNDLLHWDQGRMCRRYNKNVCGMELRLRMRILQLLAMPNWWSVGEGQLPLPVPRDVDADAVPRGTSMRNEDADPRSVAGSEPDDAGVFRF